MLRTFTWIAAVMFAALPWVLMAGCGSVQRAGKSDPIAAKASLLAVLETWQNGEKPDALRAQQPPIVAQDLQWMSGFKLTSFEILGDGLADNTNFRYPVRLVLVDPAGNKVEAKANYVVGTDPAITVFREMM